LRHRATVCGAIPDILARGSIQHEIAVALQEKFESPVLRDERLTDVETLVGVESVNTAGRI
jgi:hypothetical protein